MFFFWGVQVPADRFIAGGIGRVLPELCCDHDVAAGDVPDHFQGVASFRWDSNPANMLYTIPSMFAQAGGRLFVEVFCSLERVLGLGKGSIPLREGRRFPTSPGGLPPLHGPGAGPAAAGIRAGARGGGAGGVIRAAVLLGFQGDRPWKFGHVENWFGKWSALWFCGLRDGPRDGPRDGFYGDALHTVCLMKDIFNVPGVMDELMLVQGPCKCHRTVSLKDIPKRL